MKYLKGAILLFAAVVGSAGADGSYNESRAIEIYDESRDRHIPTEIYLPKQGRRCGPESKCQVAFLSAGYGVSHRQYTFLARQLNELGYLVVAIAHELPGDPPLASHGDFSETRRENWQRGATTLEFVRQTLAARDTAYPDIANGYDFDRLLLVGHSNGGDISALLGNEAPSHVGAIITLDHRRMALPRSQDIRILSIRASDFPADKGVLPTDDEQKRDGSCIVRIPDARHNDMSDSGPAALQRRIAELVRNFLNGQACSA